MPVKVSAPGKLIITGEHAVVYGEPAIIAAVGLRTYAEAEKNEKVLMESQKHRFRLDWTVKECADFYRKAKSLWELGAKRDPADFSEVFSLIKGNEFKKAAAGTVISRIGIEGGIRLRLNSEIPTGAGLGSSASLAVVVAKSFAELYAKRASLEKINEIAYEAEKFAAGLPSGADNSACCYGGLIWFQKDMKTGKPIVKSLKKEIPHSLKNFILAYTGKPEKTTGQLVQQVRMTLPEIRDPRIRRIGALTREMRSALKAQDFPKIKAIMNENWSLLRDFGLSTPAADKLIGKIKSIGGAAKLCGGCGGGIALCYHEDTQKLKSVIKSAGFDPMEVGLGVEGVKVER